MKKLSLHGKIGMLILSPFLLVGIIIIFTMKFVLFLFSFFMWITGSKEAIQWLDAKIKSEKIINSFLNNVKN